MTGSPTHVLVFLKQHQVLREVLPDELFDDFLFDARVQHVGHQAGVSEHIAGPHGSLNAKRAVQSQAMVWCKTGEAREDTAGKEHDDLGSLRGEGLFKICQDLSPQFALCRLHSGKEEEK